MRILALTLFLSLSSTAFASEYVLVNSVSKIQYGIFKHEPGEIEVDGNMLPDSAKLLKGLVQVDDTSSLSNLSGFIEWDKDSKDTIKRFATDSGGRDEHVEDIFKTSILVEFANPSVQYNASTGEIHLNVNITINGKTIVVPVDGRLKFGKSSDGKDIAQIVGVMRVNRKDWGLKISGLASVGDFLIDNELDLKINLIFAKLN